jgi:hypothetical protein
MHLQCVVAGGGPAGMMLGYSWCVPAFAPSPSKSTPTSLRLSRDTILPSTLDAMFELGILDESVFRLEIVQACRPAEAVPSSP